MFLACICVELVITPFFMFVWYIVFVRSKRYQY